MALQSRERAAILFVLKHLAQGLAAALTFGVCLLWFDIGGLGTLVLTSDHRFIALPLLFAGLFITFGGVAIGAGVMSLAEDRN